MFKKIALFVLLLFMVTPLTSHASSDFDFIYNSAEPTCSEGQGYLVLLMHNGNNFNTRLYSFMASSVNSSGAYMPTASNISITSNRVVFNLQTNSAAVSVFHAVYYIAQSGNMSLVGATDSHTIDITPTGGEIIAWQVYGNGYVSSNTQNSSQYWSVSFRGGDAINQYAMDISNALSEFIFSNGDNASVIIDTLIDMREYLIQVSNDVEVSKDYLHSISVYSHDILDWMVLIYDELCFIDQYLYDICETYLPDMYSSLERIEDKLDKSNSWLEKIFKWLDESREKEKEEASTQGNSSVSEGTASIEDKGGDFVGALGGLTSSMSYTGTSCAWEFPEVRLPAIAGVMDEVVLINSQPIDFTQWVNAIPSSVLLVIQSVLTIGLIVYCFKELYDTIAYVLTLRKDDNS